MRPLAGLDPVPRTRFAPEAPPGRATGDAVAGTSRRDAAIVVAVLLAHVAVLAVLLSARASRNAEGIVPARVIAESIETPARQAAPQPEAPRREPAPQPRPRPVERQPVATPPPPTPAPAAEATGASAPGAPRESVAAASPGPVTNAPVPAPPALELPSADAAYLDNPRPEYPRASRRLGEQGRVVLRVLIEADGTASRAELATSSGFERLDEAARVAVLRWRYVPGKRAGRPEAMWFHVPVNFVLE